MHGQKPHLEGLVLLQRVLETAASRNVNQLCSHKKLNYTAFVGGGPSNLQRHIGRMSAEFRDRAGNCKEYTSGKSNEMVEKSDKAWRDSCCPETKMLLKISRRKMTGEKKKQ